VSSNSGTVPAAFRAHHGVLSEGDAVRWRSEPYTVIALEGVTVHMALRPGSGLPLVALPLGLLAAADDFAVLDSQGRPVSYETLPDWSLLEGINPDAAREAYIWERHIIEVDTGLLPNQPEDAAPRPGYAADEFTLVERYKTKAAELNAVLDFDVSWHTVQRKRLQYKEKGIWGLVDKRRTACPRCTGATTRGWWMRCWHWSGPGRARRPSPRRRCLCCCADRCAAATRRV
jgi:hypothetical protein